MAKRTKAQRSASAKKAARTRRRNASASATPRRRRRRTTKKKGFLSDFTSVENRNAFNTMVSGTVGGGLYLVYEDQVTISGTTPEKKVGLAVLGAYFIGVMGKKPNVSAGVMGAAAYDFFKAKGLLQDNMDLQDPAYNQMMRQNYADPLENVPLTLSDDAMMLAQSGQMSLQDAEELDNSYLPNYADTFNY